jgi:hypothetical protein
MLVFSHIPKTAGTSLAFLLQRYYGSRLLSAQYRKDSLYKYEDLKKDLKIYPHVQCLTGHSVKPFVDFKEYNSQMHWFTFLREPKKRFISHYIHQYNSGANIQFRMDFVEWTQKYNRKNWMVRMIAGIEDLEAAKQILREKFKFVGVTEKYDESLVIMKNSLGLSDFNIDYHAPKNISKDIEIRKKISDNDQLYKDLILEQNELDIELYDYVLKNIWEKQKNDYYAPDQSKSRIIHEKIKLAEYNLFRNLIYKPYLFIEKVINK